jgi:pimeloyl-ACP methyl ester carboxylesterase
VRWRARAAALLAVAASVAGCSVGPSSRPEIVTIEGPEQQEQQPGDNGPVPVPPLEEPKDAPLRWTGCQDNMTNRLTEPPLPTWLQVQCAKVSTPLDTPYAPGRGSIKLQVLRAGTGPVPIVVVNDVGGQPGSIYAARLAASLPQDFFNRFSLIGVDRRGTGNSEPPDCVPPEVRTEILGINPKATPPDAWLEPAKNAGQQCSIELESHLPALDTWRSSADLESLRVNLGLKKLNGIGHGEGSRVLSVYADRYPDKVGRLVLDGVPDVTDDAVAMLEGVATGAEATWQAFAADCAARSCELGTGAAQAMPALLDQLGSRPLRAQNGLVIGPGAALQAVLIGLSDRARWPALGTAIDKARQGDGGPLGDFIAPIVLGSDEQAPIFDGELVIGCNDTKTRLTVTQLTKIVADWDKKYPTFGALVAQRLALCGVWPVQTQALPSPKAKGAPPIVVLGTASDPVTPISGTEHAAAQLTEAALVSWQGAGHGALGVSSCATDAALGFLRDAKVPRNGTVCPP